MGTSEGKRTLSIDTRSNTVSVQAKEKVGKTGRVYEFRGVLTGKKINKWNFSAVITLFDSTIGKEIRKTGTKEETFKAGAYTVWIKNLEGHKEVFLNLDKIGELGKIQEETQRGKTFFALNPWLAGNM